MRTFTFLPLALVLLPACQGPEEGLDKSIIRGTVTIPGVVVEEFDRAAANSNNNSIDAPQGLGPDGAISLTYRSVTVPGSCKEFGTELGDPLDPDYYEFSPVAAGDFTIRFTYEAGGAATEGSGYTDANVYNIAVIDEATGNTVSGGSTDGLGGAWEDTLTVTAAGKYILYIWGEYGETKEESPYTIFLSGSVPQDDSILVGAYLEGDPAVASAPVGGTTVNNWVWDEATTTWTGQYEALFMRSTVWPEGYEESEEPVNPDVNEQLDEVFLMAGTLQSLNKTPSAGSLYSTASVTVKLNHGEVDVPETITLDGVFPKVIGQTVVEEQPDATNADVVFNDEVGVYTLDFDTLAVQDLGMLSGLGYVDVVDGNITFGGEGWNGANDSDAFAFTVPEPMYVSMVAGWPDASADIDFGIWGDYEPYGVLDYFSSFSNSYCLTGADPEVCTTVVPLEPDIQYYLVALGYLGGDAQDYHIELEWLGL